MLLGLFRSKYTCRMGRQSYRRSCRLWDKPVSALDSDAFRAIYSVKKSCHSRIKASPIAARWSPRGLIRRFDTSADLLGAPTTLLNLLQTHLPLLFPPTSKTPYPMAIPLLLGVPIPPETGLAWASACLCGADGWLRVGIRLKADA